jgi:hypothetical protein
MDRNIQIEIKDRIAHLVGNPKIICGNNDYSVTFAFDDEWAGVDVKTLRVSYNNKYSDHVFTGDTVELPPIIKAVEVYLGVFAGDITSTRVAVRAEPSILCSGGSVADPEPDVYHQLIELINSKEPSGGVAVETDPTVPAWAKQPKKPVYTAEEVGAASAEAVRQLSEEKADKKDVPTPYTLPVATADTLGGIKVGNGLVMDGEALAISDGLTLFDSVEVKDGEIIESFRWDYQNVKELQIFALFPKAETDERISGNIGGVGIYMPNLISKLADQYLWIRWEKRENTFPLYGIQASREGYHTQVYTLGMYMTPMHEWPDTPIRFYGRSGGYPVGTKISIYGRVE